MDSQRAAPLTAYLSIAVAVAAFALITLDRAGIAPSLRGLTSQFYLWLLLLGAVALLLGTINLAWVHLLRIQKGQAGWVYSLVLVAALGAVLVAGIINDAGTTSPLVELIFDSIILPGQATLFALLVFFMAAAAYRFLRIGRTGGAWMLAAALLVLAVQMPAANALLPAALRGAAVWLVDVPVMAATRGALLGASVALLVVSISFLLRQG